jgi:mannose-1-phosphate guanylyltransferase
LLAAVPDGPETDYGWIEPGEAVAEIDSGAAARKVTAFREKPSAERADEYFRGGYLWNTMIVVGRARTLWQLGRRTLPEMIDHFEMLRRVTEAVQSGRASATHLRTVVEEMYEHLEPANFSRDLLEKVPDSTLVLPLEDIHWSDWGRPERISRSLARIGVEPNFAGVASGASAADRELVAAS